MAVSMGMHIPQYWKCSESQKPVAPCDNRAAPDNSVDFVTERGKAALFDFQVSDGRFLLNVHLAKGNSDWTTFPRYLKYFTISLFVF